MIISSTRGSHDRGGVDVRDDDLREAAKSHLAYRLMHSEKPAKIVQWFCEENNKSHPSSGRALRGSRPPVTGDKYCDLPLHRERTRMSDNSLSCRGPLRQYVEEGVSNMSSDLVDGSN